MIGLGNSVVKRKIFAPSVPAAPVNVVLPSLTGTGLVGSTITCNKGKWTGVPTPTYEYDFKADGVSVQFGLSNEYVTSGPDIDKVITCEVTATNSQGSASATTSNSITVGTAPTNTVLPTIDVTGNQVIGTVLTATDGTWTGSTPITYEYRWTRNGVAITGATTNTYTLQAADESATIRVQVRGINSYATSAYVTSDDSVVGGYAPVNTGLPAMSLSGNQLVGTLVTVTDGTWTGTPTVTLQYRWLRNGSPIGGAINNTYTLVAADDGATITAQVRGTNAWGTSAYSTSSNSINAGTAPVNAVAPTVSPSGTQSTGTVITANVGTWSGTPTITYAYRWTRNGSPISGATASTYTIQVADDGTTIRCEVQGSNAFGTSAYVASSNSVSAVNAIAPVNVNPPQITGTAVVGQTLSSTTGTWTGIPTPTYSYQWRRGGVDIGGATSSTYTLVQADAGNTSNITCRVTATNAAGSANATSNTIAQIFDADAQAFRNRVTTAGGTLATTESNAVNQLVVDMKSANIWNLMRVVYPMVGSSAAACAQNLVSASFTGSFTPGWTFASTGVSGNGTSAYFNTTFNPSTQLTFTNGHVSLYKNLGTISASDRVNGLYDVGGNPISFTLNPDRNTTAFSQGDMGSYTPDTSVGGSSLVQGNGFYVIARNANNFVRLNRNNTNNITNTTTSSPAAFPNDNMWLGAAHQVGTTAVYGANSYRYAFMSMGNYLDATQASNFYNIVQAFQTTLSRQV